MDLRYKIIISLAIIMALFVGGLAGALYIKEYNYFSEEAALYGISPGGLSLKELKTEIENKKAAIILANQLKSLQEKAESYGLEWEGLYIEELQALIENYELNRVSIRGKIISIVNSTDKKTRTWTVIGEKTPNTDYSEARILVNAETKIYKGDTDETVSFDKVNESTEIEVVFAGFADETAVPVLAFAGKVVIITE